MVLGTFIFAKTYYHRYDWVPMEVSIGESNYSYSGSCISEYDGSHRIYLEIDRQHNSDKAIECFFGVEITKTDCGTSRSFAKLEWEISENNAPFKSGLIQDNWEAAYWGANGSASSVFRFNTIKGNKYALKFKLFAPDKIIKQSNPRIKVELPAILHKNSAIISGIAELICFLLLAVGSIVFIFEVIQATKRKPSLHL